MNHAITIGGLLSVLAIIIGLIGAAIGALAIFAGGMSDAPQAGDSAASTGCLVLVGGAVLVALGLWGVLA